MARPNAAERAAADTLARLRALHPDAHCELVHDGPFQLLVATVLSAQTTDRNVNLATPALFARYPDAHRLAAADVDEVAERIATISFYRTKAKHLVALARLLVERHHGEVPKTMAELCALPGVGRKTANVVLGDAFGLSEGVVVDTHVQRLSQRLGWSRAAAPEQIERDLVRLFPQREWGSLAHVLIFHGRRVCSARAPSCATCGVAPACPSAGAAEGVGRKPPRKAPAPAERGAAPKARAAGAGPARARQASEGRPREARASAAKAPPAERAPSAPPRKAPLFAEGRAPSQASRPKAGPAARASVRATEPAPNPRPARKARRA
ncbi:MAG TPA: endonuclease III [Polyangiaceae bacterium]|nr:endonuclease III [Polyangiaceae bacterium]